MEITHWFPLLKRSGWQLVEALPLPVSGRRQRGGSTHRVDARGISGLPTPIRFAAAIDVPSSRSAERFKS